MERCRFAVVSNNRTKPTPAATTYSTPQSSPTPDETASTEQSRSANWKTYTNTQYGYSIKYPLNLIPREQTSDTFLLLTVFDDPANQEGPLRGFSIEVTKPKTLEEEATYRKWQISHLSLEGGPNESKIVNDAHEGIRLEFVTPEGGQANIMFTTGSYNYTLGGKSELLDQVLSTFNFLTQKQSNYTANWKTYQGRNFSIKYPAIYTYGQNELPTSPEYPIIDEGIRLRSGTDDIFITVATNYKNLNSTNALGKGPFSRYGNEFLDGKSMSVLKVDTVDAISVKEVSAGALGSISDLIAIKNNKVFQINITPVTEQNYNVLQQILSTFRFLDSETSSE